MATFFAHGALGYWDEVIFVSVAVGFLLMMGRAWLRGRSEGVETLHSEGAPAAWQDGERFQLD